MAESPLPIDPYLYGFWLGNGNAVKPEITVRTCDIPNMVKQIPYEISNAWEQTGGGSWVFRIPAMKSILVKSFREKHIPAEYMCSSAAQRWALLQGLMDSDGSVSTVKSQSTYVSTVRQLAIDVRELLWSLGIKNSMTEEPSMRYGIPTGETLYCKSTSCREKPGLHRRSRGDESR